MYAVVGFIVFVLGPVFSEGCGQRPGVRIIGGSTATPNSWPWQLSLRVMGVHNCGASLISHKWAVTAAHCVDSYYVPHVYSLVAGVHRIQGDGDTYRVNKIIMHAGFSMSHLRNDIALMRLVKPVQLGPKVGTVCFPRKNTRVAPGTKCWISGWGTQRFSFWGNVKPTSHLQQANVPVVDYSTWACAKKAGSKVHDQTMVCVGGAGKVACHGDSGGPLVCEENGRWVLRGVASWTGDRKCKTDNYSMYACVSSYMTWIENQIASAGDGDDNKKCKDEVPEATCLNSLRHCYLQQIYSKCLKTCSFCVFLLGITAVPREIESNAYAKLWGANKDFKFLEIDLI